MFDIRQEKQNTQIAGTFDDISHLGGSNFKENNPVENMVHQRTLQRKLRQQETRRSIQENERQETKPTVAQPVLNPSIQSESDPDPPPDQSCKHHDASAKLSTVKSVYPRKIQNLSREIRSNQETAYKAVERQKAEPQKVEPQKVRQVNPQEGKHSLTFFRDLNRNPNVRHTYQPSMSDIRQAKQNTQLAGTFDDISHLSSKPQQNKPLENIVHPTILHRMFRQQESRRSSQESERQEIKSTVAQPVLNPKYSSIQSKSDLDASPDQPFIRQDASAQLSTLKTVNPKKIKNPPQEIGSGKEAAQQAIEPQKVERVDSQENRDSLTHFHESDLDHNPSVRVNSSLVQLTTKPHEINSARYTHDKFEYTAQWVRNNISSHHPTKAHLPTKIKDQEAGEIEPEEVKPQDVVPNLHSQKTKAVKAPGKKGRNSEKKTSGGAFAFLKGALARLVEADDLSPDDIIIAVMGPTGSGKSTFINIITGFETVVGHDLELCTRKVSNVRLSMPELAYGDLVFVDTPGFGDSNNSDIDILKMVANWLRSTYAKDISLSGILYFHRISDNRMVGTPLKTLRMFEELCGKNSFQNVILATTMWDEIDEETGVAREAELKSKYWRGMLDRNSTTGRFLRTRESAFTLIDPIIDAANTRSSVLLQREMVDMRKKLPATSAAGQELFSKMELLVRQREELRRRIRNEMQRADSDKTTLLPLQEEHENLKVYLESTVKEMRKLKLPLGQRLVKMTETFGSRFTFTFFKSMMSKPSSAY